MTYEQIVFAWNAQADEHNQYDTLSDRERIEFVLIMATRQEQPIAKIVCGTGGGCSLEFTNGADSLDYAGCDVYLRPPIVQEPHPPTRHCMCEDCTPSFEQTSDGLAPVITDAMALAFHSSLTDSSIGQGEIDEIKTGLRAALCAEKPVENQEPIAWKNTHAPNGLRRFMTQKQYDANPRLQKYYEPFNYTMQPCPGCEKLKDDVAELEGVRELNRCAIKNLKAERDKFAEELRLSKHGAEYWRTEFLKARKDRNEQNELLKKEQQAHLITKGKLIVCEAQFDLAIGAEPSKENPCSTHPDAPHGFDRTASHSLGRYVCNCEGWEPSV